MSLPSADFVIVVSRSQRKTRQKYRFVAFQIIPIKNSITFWAGNCYFHSCGCGSNGSNKELYRGFSAIALLVARWFVLKALGGEVGDDGVRLGLSSAHDAG